MPRIGRSAQACILCHKRKIKCDLASGKETCTNCEAGNHRCRPHERKRKRYSSSASPQPVSEQRWNAHRHDVEDGYQAERQPGSWKPTTLSPAVASNSRVTPAAISASPRSRRQDVSPRQPSSMEARQLHTPTESSYLGRSDYLGGNIPFNEEMATERGCDAGMTSTLSDADVQVLRIYKAFDLPPRAIRENLIDKYLELCYPWAPIVDRSWLNSTDAAQPSMLLLQAVFLAGSRVSSSALQHATSEDFYQRARAIFFSGHEKNVLFQIVALCLLQWWNRTGPERISTDTSGFWVRVAVGMAYQAGLHKEMPSSARKEDRMIRRRLWWTLVCRDSIISVGLGRPRTINLEDSDVSRPSVEDFPTQDAKARLFVEYVTICQLLGDVAQCFRRKWRTSPWRNDLDNSLYRWIKELPSELQVFRKERQVSVSPHYFEARQLHVPFLVTLVILHRGPAAGRTPSAVSLVASAYIASIYEEFIARDELQHLGPAFTFYALAAGLSQLSGYRYDSLAKAADENFGIIRLSLELLGERWGSANGALRALSEARNAVLKLSQYREPPLCIPDSCVSLLSDFDPSLCNMGHLLAGKAVYASAEWDIPGQPVLSPPAVSQSEGHTTFVEPGQETNCSGPPAAPPLQFPEFEETGYGQQQFDSMWGTVDTIGAWLINDFGYQDMTF